MKICIDAIDIDSENYVLFIYEYEVLQRFEVLSKNVNHRIDFTKNI